MSDEPRQFRKILSHAVSAVWSNRWVRILLIILFTFEIYNTAVLPAIRGTIEIETLGAERDAAEADARAKTASSVLPSGLAHAAPASDTASPITTVAGCNSALPDEIASLHHS